ncbi:hypothetical protein HO173_002424 [Letharia columbiana]|uniref:Uncharacterized protein n=1 Tax=Letharia columbiana TaxID=112416 RepID=A0A8H6G3I4_9LECA|nr:uncharacterized protein HO173_002424 [Letharia columbiana]KAF6239877.1 hypothetical protein HO173_002424 [Letharia columbiana]
MPSKPKPLKPPRHTPKVVAIILCFSILRVNDKVVSELIKLKDPGTVEIEAIECQARRGFHERSDFPNRGMTKAGVGELVARKVVPDYDEIIAITEIDGECEEVLSKHSDIPLAELKDGIKEIRAAAMKTLNIGCDYDIGQDFIQGNQPRSPSQDFKEYVVESQFRPLPTWFQEQAIAVASIQEMVIRSRFRP